MQNIVVIEGEVALTSTISGEIDLTSQICGEIEKVLWVDNRNAYTGDYVVTPTDEEIILETANKIMTDNVIVNPIPSNYGLITWNGSVLTVS